MSLPRSSPRSSRRRRGTTLVEVVLAASISTLVLLAGVGLFLMGMRSWLRGEANMDVNLNSQKSTRVVSNELREAMSVTIVSPTRISYVLPLKGSDGTFVSPLTGDGINRTITLTGSNLVLAAGSVSRVIARNILTREPGASADYAVFSSPAGSVSRSLTIKLVAGTVGVRNESIVERSRETLYLRNVPQLSR